ncbi:MAG TPA: NAD-dependent epimerase/dehydratase family protein [Pseudorhizobium sp.]|nr:NAD-dependent epimerase/dehydratase family protein [Pseudorhizobium sp.]
MILVTGGTGFVGSGLAAALSLRALPFRLASRMPINGGAAVGDINGETNWSLALDGISTVVHLAGIAHRTAERPSPGECRRVNVDGTLGLAEQAAAAGVRRIVFVSSIGVLGQTTRPGERLSEASSPDPRTVYARSKHEAELALSNFCHASSLEFVIVRPPLVYGSNAKGNFGRLVDLVASGWPLPFASVRNRRNMISLPNLAEALIECVSNPAAANETFVVAEPQPVSTADVVAAIAAGLSRRPRLVNFPVKTLGWGLRVAGRSAMADGLLESLEIDSSKIGARLGWMAKGETLENIVNETRATS